MEAKTIGRFAQTTKHEKGEWVRVVVKGRDASNGRVFLEERSGLLEEIKKRRRELQVVLQDDDVTVVAMLEELRQDECIVLLDSQKPKRVLCVSLRILELEHSHGNGYRITLKERKGVLASDRLRTA